MRVTGASPSTTISLTRDGTAVSRPVHTIQPCFGSGLGWGLVSGVGNGPAIDEEMC